MPVFDFLGMVFGTVGDMPRVVASLMNPAAAFFLLVVALWIGGSKNHGGNLAWALPMIGTIGLFAVMSAHFRGWF